MFCWVDEVFCSDSTCFVEIYHEKAQSSYKLIITTVIVVVGDTNPYQTEATSAEFFSCGFLQHTYIFVAESLVDEVSWLSPLCVYLPFYNTTDNKIVNYVSHIQYCHSVT